MSNTRIIEIPATMQTGKGKNHAIRKLRVAAYCRVSTEEEEQQSSFETQKLYYTEKITSTPEWEIAGIYADDGISGVHTKKRDGFNQMIQDCKKRKIDLILTKSISRFARNTLDSIQYVRMLKALGIAVIFEKENINTSTMNSEMILTVLSAFAQAESESISQNVARGKRMGFRQISVSLQTNSRIQKGFGRQAGNHSRRSRSDSYDIQQLSARRQFTDDQKAIRG